MARILFAGLGIPAFSALVVASDPSLDPLADVPAIAARIDELTRSYRKKRDLEVAPPASDAAFLRRLTLDLTGRIPAVEEAKAFLADGSPGKRERAVRRLLESPDFALHFGRVLDDMVQGKYAGDGEFIEYLRSSVRELKPWDQVFREILLGPWDTPERKRAERFLRPRMRNIDDLTTDTATVFFGVNVSCAKCHDHPLVDDWKQDHYYGMASFLNRTYEHKQGKESIIGEKPSGDVKFVPAGEGKERTAKMLFLSGRVVEEPEDNGNQENGGRSNARKKSRNKAYSPPPHSRRKLLVEIALEDKRFFSRSLVNHMWAYLLGQGLVEPLDQMHSGNRPSIPGLLEWLAEDFAASGYRLDRLLAAIVSSECYGLSSTWDPKTERPRPKHFSVAQVRPLTPQQLALSITFATGDLSLDDGLEPQAREKRLRELESRSTHMTRHNTLDQRTNRFQSSATEALFMSNHPDVQELVKPAGDNLVARLLKLADDEQVVETAMWTVLSRPPEDDEKEYLKKWLGGRKEDRASACGELVWALFTSAEFRFNH